LLGLLFLPILLFIVGGINGQGSGTNELSRVDNPTTTNGPYFQFDLSKKTTGLNAR
jgi:hypothetical protein